VTGTMRGAELQNEESGYPHFVTRSLSGIMGQWGIDGL
jgi:hypothetical protein